MYTLVGIPMYTLVGIPAMYTRVYTTMYTLGTPSLMVHLAHACRYPVAGLMRGENSLGSNLRISLGMRRRVLSRAQRCDSC